VSARHHRVRLGDLALSFRPHDPERAVWFEMGCELGNSFQRGAAIREIEDNVCISALRGGRAAHHRCSSSLQFRRKRLLDRTKQHYIHSRFYPQLVEA